MNFKTFEQIRHEGFTHVLALHISSNLSGTVETVRMVARDFENLKINVMDTKTLSMGTGWMVLDAARNITDGLSFERVVENLQRIQAKVEVYYIIETLEYLRRGGRIGRVASMLDVYFCTSYPCYFSFYLWYLFILDQLGWDSICLPFYWF